MASEAVHTKPAWVREVKARLARPRRPEEQARIEWSIREIERLHAGTTWPPGTVERLLELAHQEDEADERSYLEDGA